MSLPSLRGQVIVTREVQSRSCRTLVLWTCKRDPAMLPSRSKNHPMKYTVLHTLAVTAFASAVFAQAPTDTPPEKAAVIANDRAYEAAYAKADAKALTDFFAEDAEYTADDGRTFSGRAEIGEAM